MIGTDLKHCQILGKSISGERAVDEQTFASLAILGERLDRLKKFDRLFSGVEFSSAVKKLKGQVHKLDYPILHVRRSGRRSSNQLDFGLQDAKLDRNAEHVVLHW